MPSASASIWRDKVRAALEAARTGVGLPVGARDGERVFSAVDSHTAGMPTRILTHGFGVLPGSSMRERMQHLQLRHDDVRLLLMREPRGHAAMCGALIQPPLEPGTDLGVLFFTAGGYLEMCGHAAIGVCSALVASGAVAPTGPITNLRLDTAAGVIDADVEMVDGRVSSVTIRNLVAQTIALDLTIEAKAGTIQCDLAFAGGVYAIVRAETVGMSLSAQNLGGLAAVGGDIMRAVDGAVPPAATAGGTETLPPCEHVVFFEEGDGDLDLRSATVHKGFVDRSPCGTGTSALLATMHARGLLQVGSQMVNRSVNQGKFVGHLTAVRTTQGEVQVVNAITGQSWITGVATYILETDDPLTEGFFWPGT